MARDKDQIIRFNSAELSLMKNTFADNEALLYAIRKVLLQFPLTEEEIGLVSSLVNEEVYGVVRKMVLPELDGDAPLLQLADIKVGLNIDFSKYGPDEIGPYIEAKDIEIDFLEQQFELLRNIRESRPVVIALSKLAATKGKDSYEAFVNITARNFLLSYVDSCMQQIRFLAGKKEESVEQTLKRLQQNSSK